MPIPKYLKKYADVLSNTPVETAVGVPVRTKAGERVPSFIYHKVADGQYRIELYQVMEFRSCDQAVSVLKPEELFFPNELFAITSMVVRMNTDVSEEIKNRKDYQYNYENFAYCLFSDASALPDRNVMQGFANSFSNVLSNEAIFEYYVRIGHEQYTFLKDLGLME